RHCSIAVKIPCLVGFSKLAPHCWNTPVTKPWTCSRTLASVAGCPRISKNSRFALSKHRRSSSRTNSVVTSASLTRGATYASVAMHIPEGGSHNAVIFKGTAFFRRVPPFSDEGRGTSEMGAKPLCGLGLWRPSYGEDPIVRNGDCVPP